MAVIRTGREAVAQTPVPVRIKQVQAALFLPAFAYMGFVLVGALSKVVTGLLYAVNVTTANFLSPVVGIGLFLAMIWVLFKWVASGGFGMFGPVQ